MGEFGTAPGAESRPAARRAAARLHISMTRIHRGRTADGSSDMTVVDHRHPPVVQHQPLTVETGGRNGVIFALEEVAHHPRSANPSPEYRPAQRDELAMA